MDRIHRLGQHRPVKAIKLVIENSIESKIVQVGPTFPYTFDLCLSSAAPREEVGDGRCNLVH